VVSESRISFIGYTYVGGHVWAKASDLESVGFIDGPEPEPDEMLLVPAVSWNFDAKDHMRGYQPADNFFTLVADLEPSPDAIKKFVDQFGLLGVDHDIVIPKSNPRVGQPMPADRLTTWLSFVAELTAAVELELRIQEAERLKDPGPLEGVIQWTPDGNHVYYKFPPRAPWTFGSDARVGWKTTNIADRQTDPELISRFKPGDLLAPAQHYFRRLIGKHLESGLSGRFVQLPPEPGSTEPRQGLYFQPDSLGVFLWTQLADAVGLGKKIRRCLNCRKWLVIHPTTTGERVSRLTCSDRCRTQLWLKRKKDALRLHGTGLSAAEIAELLDAEVPSVKQWIKAAAKGTRKPGRPKKTQ